MPSISNRLSHSTAYAEAITLLIRHGGTVSEISEHSGLGDVTVRKLVQALHRRGVIRVALWRRDRLGRAATRVWVVGSGPDAARPPATTGQQRVEAYNEQRREIGERLGIPMRDVRLRHHRGAPTP